MIITLSPMAGLPPLTLSRAGDTLVFNGDPVDFSAIPEGGVLPLDSAPVSWIASDVTRVSGEITLTIFLPHGPDAPEATRFPVPLDVSGDGEIALPPFAAP